MMFGHYYIDWDAIKGIQPGGLYYLKLSPLWFWM